MKLQDICVYFVNYIYIPEKNSRRGPPSSITGSPINVTFSMPFWLNLFFLARDYSKIIFECISSPDRNYLIALSGAEICSLTSSSWLSCVSDSKSIITVPTGSNCSAQASACVSISLTEKSK